MGGGRSAERGAEGTRGGRRVGTEMGDGASGTEEEGGEGGKLALGKQGQAGRAMRWVSLSWDCRPRSLGLPILPRFGCPSSRPHRPLPATKTDLLAFQNTRHLFNAGNNDAPALSHHTLDATAMICARQTQQERQPQANSPSAPPRTAPACNLEGSLRPPFRTQNGPIVQKLATRPCSHTFPVSPYLAPVTCVIVASHPLRRGWA